MPSSGTINDLQLLDRDIVYLRAAGYNQARNMVYHVVDRSSNNVIWTLELTPGMDGQGFVTLVGKPFRGKEPK